MTGHPLHTRKHDCVPRMRRIAYSHVPDTARCRWSVGPLDHADARDAGVGERGSAAAGRAQLGAG